MQQDLEILELANAEYFDSLLNGECGGGELEVYAASVLHNWNISVHEPETKSVFTQCPILKVILAKSGDYFAIKMIE
jgi:hypothetical protein